MRRSLIIILFFLAGCATTGIDAGRSDRTLLLVPFTSSQNYERGVYSEAEEVFRKLFTGMNYRVVRRDILKEKGYSSGSLTEESIREIGKDFGAGYILTGEIAENREFERGNYKYNSFIYGSQVLKDGQDGFNDVNARVILKYQLRVKLYNTSDGTVIISKVNSPDEVEKNVKVRDSSTLELYRAYVLQKMKDEFEEEFKRK